LSWCPLTWYVYIVYNILLWTCLQFILSKAELCHHHIQGQTWGNVFQVITKDNTIRPTILVQCPCRSRCGTLKQILMKAFSSKNKIGMASSAALPQPITMVVLPFPDVTAKGQSGRGQQYVGACGQLLDLYHPHWRSNKICQGNHEPSLYWKGYRNNYLYLP